MSNLKYSPFILSHEEAQDKQQKQDIQNKKRRELIKQHVISNKYIELKNDYFGMDSYYYDEKYNRMNKVSNHFSFNDKLLTPHFELCNDNHIMKLNGITY